MSGILFRSSIPWIGLLFLNPLSHPEVLFMRKVINHRLRSWKWTFMAYDGLGLCNPKTVWIERGTKLRSVLSGQNYSPPACEELPVLDVLSELYFLFFRFWIIKCWAWFSLQINFVSCFLKHNSSPPLSFLKCLGIEGKIHCFHAAFVLSLKKKSCCLGRYKMPQDYFPTFTTIAYYECLGKKYISIYAFLPVLETILPFLYIIAEKWKWGLIVMLEAVWRFQPFQLSLRFSNKPTNVLENLPSMLAFRPLSSSCKMHILTYSLLGLCLFLLQKETTIF